MRNPEQTIGNFIDKQKVSFIASISQQGFPNMKAMLSPRKRVGIKEFWFSTNTWLNIGKILTQAFIFMTNAFFVE